MARERRFSFVRWLDAEKTLAIFRDNEEGVEFVVPRSRIIPYPGVEEEYYRLGVTDPNVIVELVAEEQRFFGIPIWRWLEKKKSLGEFWITEHDLREAYYWPRNVDFPCIRDCILAGERMSLCAKICTTGAFQVTSLAE